METKRKTGNPKLGHRLLEARERAGLTQVRLGQLVGVNGRSIGAYEEAKMLPCLTVFVRLCRSLDVSMDEMMKGVTW